MRIGNYVFDPVVAQQMGMKIGYAVAVLLVVWALAKGAKWAFARMVDMVPFLQRGTGSGESLGNSLGRIVNLFIWLFGLLAILDILGLEGVITPLNELLNSVMGFVPNLVGAGLIFFIGHTIVRILKDLVTTALQTVDFDKWANKGGVEAATGNTAISETIGKVVYVLLIIPVAIGAIDTLGIEGVSGPATAMLGMILGAVPNIIVAAIFLGIGYLVAGFVANFLKEILADLGVDRAVAATEILPEGTAASSALSRLAQVAIMLFAAIGAMRALGFPELTEILDAVLELGGRVVFGGVVIVAGFLVAGLLAKLIGGSGGGSLAGSLIKWAAVVLFTFMGLEFMGVGEEIVRYAFGALAAGGAVAAALAFGLGGREWAARQLDKIGK